MLERPIHDSNQSEVLDAIGLERDPLTQEERLKNAELNENFMNSIQELQLFFEKYHGTHSER